MKEYRSKAIACSQYHYIFMPSQVVRKFVFLEMTHFSVVNLYVSLAWT